MTYKYLLIRREMFVNKPMEQVDKKRGFREMCTLFTWKSWLMLGIMFSTLIPLLLRVVFYFDVIFTVFLLIIQVLVYVIYSTIDEKHLYNENVRNDEISKLKLNNEECVLSIFRTLKANGIDSNFKFNVLLDECSNEVKSYIESVNKRKKTIYELLIGVPLGALVASVIYANNGAALESIVVLVVVGIISSIIHKIINSVIYRTELHYQDKYLLDCLNEIKYNQDIFNTSNITK